MDKAIYFDMDGTIVDFYAVDGWLNMLENRISTPYKIAKPLFNMAHFARMLHNAQCKGYFIGIVTWLPKNSVKSYNKEVALEKEKWLKAHLPSVIWDEIIIIPYGINKSSVVKYPQGILFDDELNNIKEWNGIAYTPKKIYEILKKLSKIA